MNRTDFSSLLAEVMHELTEENGTFRDTFGEASEETLQALSRVAAVALMAADRYYAHLTKSEFAIREAAELHLPKTEVDV